METIWLLRNEKSIPTTSNTHDSAGDHEGSPCLRWKDQFLCFRRCNWWLVWHYGVVAGKTWTCIEEQSRRWSISVQKTTEQRVFESWETQMTVYYFKRVLRPHFINGAQTVFLYRSMQFRKRSRGKMDLQKWMTRFNLLEIDLLSLGWISYQIWRPPVQKQLHMLHDAVKNMKLDKLILQALQQLLQDKNHMSMYLGQMNWHWQHSCNSTQTNTTEIGIPLGWQLVSIDFCKPGGFDARSEKHTHKYHDTSWKNIRSVQCARTQRFIPGNVLR